VILLTLLTLLPLIAYAGWGEKVAETQILEAREPNTGGDFAISLVPNGRQRNPVIACSPAKRCLAVWEAYSEGSWRIYGQWVVNGKLEGDNFPVSATPSDQHDPVIAYNGSEDEYLVVWWDDRDRVATGYNIYGRLIAGNGQENRKSKIQNPKSEDCPIATAPGDQQHPDIVYNSANGEYLVVWQDLRHGDWDIYGRRVSSDCAQLDSDFPISRVAGRQWHPAVAYNSVDNQYLAVWWDNRDLETTGENIYGQIVSYEGLPLGDNFPISTADGLQYFPDVAHNSRDNEYLAVWADNRNVASTGFDIYGQRISSQGELLDDEGNPGADPGVNFAISRAANGQEYPVLAYDDDLNQYLAVWQDLRYGHWDIFAQLISGQGELLDKSGRPDADPAANFPLSAAPSDQEHPTLAYGQDEYLVVWQWARSPDFEEDIYGRRISGSGELLGSDFPLVTTFSHQMSPAAAYDDSSHNYLVVWNDDRNSADTAYDIYGQIVDITGALQGANFPISTATRNQYFPAVASNAKGEFLVVWQDARHGNWDIYGQHISSEGTLDGASIAISTAPSEQCFPVLASGAEDRYLVVWQDYRNGNWDIYGQCISFEGVQGDNFWITIAPDNQERPDVVYNSVNDEYMVIWQDYRNGNWDIYGRKVSGDCSLLGDEFPVSKALGRQWYPALAYSSSENRYLAVWWDDRNWATTDGDIYGQRLSSEGQLLGQNFPISTAQGLQCFPDVAYSSFDNEYLVVWGDYRNSTTTGFDIYGQRVAGDGEIRGENFPLSRAADDQRHPALAYNHLEDQGLAVWQDRRHYDALGWEIYGKLLMDVAVSKQAPIKAPPDSNIIYTISYANESAVEAQNVMITDALPSATTYISDTAPFSRTVVENTVVWELGTLDGGASGQFTLMVKVSPTATFGSLLTNTVQISASLPESDYSNNSAQTATKVPSWTFMAYLNGDNDLDPFMQEALNNMELAAQNPDVNILVLWDRCSLLSDDGRECLDKDEGIENTRLYRVEYDDSDLIRSPVQEVDWNPGELNMGDPDTLVNFVTWARDNYPARYYFLSVLDHGGGWSPTFTTPSQRQPSLALQEQFIPLRRSYWAFGGTGLGWDFSADYDHLSTAEMRRALCTITMEGSDKIDIVFYDACLMGMIEEAYEIKDYVNYFIASENEAWGSMPYNRYINSITPSIQPRELAIEIVKDYTESLPLTGHPSTMSAVDLAAIKEVSLAIDGLARAMINGLSWAETVLEIRNAYLSTQKFDYDSDFRLEGELDGYVDLYHLAWQIQENVADIAIATAAQSVINALEPEDSPFVIAERHRSGCPWMVTEPPEYWNLDNAYGISIYFPLGQDLQMTLESEEGITQTVKVRDWYTDEQLSFAADTQWDEFIAAYYAVISTPVPTSTLQGPRGGIRPIRWRVYLPIALKGSEE